MGKNWEDMSNKERAEITFRDIKARQDRREKERLIGERQADNFIYDNIYKKNKLKNKIRCKCYK